MIEPATRSVVLLSGGIDSATALAISKAQGFEIYALTFDYKQRHAREIDAARRIAAHIGVKEHVVTKIDLRVFGGSALTDEIAVPKGRTIEQMARAIPVTYVPARNTIFLSFALAWAEVLHHRPTPSRSCGTRSTNRAGSSPSPRSSSGRSGSACSAS